MIVRLCTEVARADVRGPLPWRLVFRVKQRPLLPPHPHDLALQKLRQKAVRPTLDEVLKQFRASEKFRANYMNNEQQSQTEAEKAQIKQKWIDRGCSITRGA